MFQSAEIKSGYWVYIISLVDKSLAFEWFFREMKPMHDKILIVFLHPSEPLLKSFCDKLGYETKWMKYEGKKDFIFTFFKLFSLFKKTKPSLIHAHLFDASILALAAAKFSGVKHRIHTRHHASHHHIYFPHAVKYDKWINNLSTKIFAISENVKDILVKRENVSAEKIKVVYHGFDIDFFEKVNTERIEKISIKYNIRTDQPVVGMISRYTYWKGIQYVIPAFKKILADFPDAVLILANAKGDYTSEIKKQLQILPDSSYREILFEDDSPALFHLFNVFVHIPVDEHSEAFGQVFIESLAAKTPSVFTLSGIAAEFAKNNINSVVVPFCDEKETEKAIRMLLSDHGFARKIAANGNADVKKGFGINVMIKNTLEGYGC